MGLDAFTLPVGQLVAHVGPEAVHGVAALGPSLGPEVGLQVGLPQALPSPVGQGGHRVGLDADDSRHLGRCHSLDLGQPQHRPPTLRERFERLTDEVPLEISENQLVGGAAGCRPVGKLAAKVELLLPPVPVDGGITDAGEQIGAEGELPVDHPGQGGENLGEAFGHRVFGVGGGLCRRARHPPGRVVVAQVERPERPSVPSARPNHQLAIAQERRAGEIGGRWGLAQRQPFRQRSERFAACGTFAAT